MVNLPNWTVIYDTMKGENIYTATEKVINDQLSGLIFNDVLIRRPEGATAQDLVDRYVETVRANRKYVREN